MLFYRYREKNHKQNQIQVAVKIVVLRVQSERQEVHSRQIGADNNDYRNDQ